MVNSEREALIKEIAEMCAEICDEHGDDVENGNIFINEQKYWKNIDSGHLGVIPWKCAELIRERFCK